jgi:hypothetical protein
MRTEYNNLKGCGARLLVKFVNNISFIQINDIIFSYQSLDILRP